jgi:tRNA threonylcarbamoyladenosine biosynthesis protein TsaB
LQLGAQLGAQLGSQLGDQWFDRHNETNHSLDVAVAMDARMDEIYAAIYRWTGGQWHTVQAPALYTLPALVAAWQQPPMPLDVKLLAGSALRAFGPRLLLPPWPALQRVEQETQRAVALMNVAQQLWRLGHAQDAAHALPLYLRDKVAQTTTEREAARAAKAAL